MTAFPGEHMAPGHTEDEVPPETPPSYTSNSPSSTFPQGRPETSPVVPNIKPANYVLVSRSSGSVEGTFAIDPLLQIPPSFLPALADGETEATRCNLKLFSAKGSVDVDVFILCDHSKLRRSATMSGWGVKMDMKATRGSITARLHVPNANPHPPLQLTAYAPYGTIRIHIPRSFRGPIVAITTNRSGSFSFSEGVTANLTAFGEVDMVSGITGQIKSRTSRSFVGDLLGWTEGEGWEGDRVTVTTGENVEVQYDDEVITRATEKQPDPSTHSGSTSSTSEDKCTIV